MKQREYHVTLEKSIENLEEEMKTMAAQLKEKDLKIEELTSTIGEWDKKINELEHLIEKNKHLVELNEPLIATDLSFYKNLSSDDPSTWNWDMVVAKGGASKEKYYMDLYGPEGLERQTRVKNNIRGVIRNLVPLYYIF